ncbi:hypothetical protein GV791_26695 [Nocardia cyriacigeorgica]|uniref:Uncharacterized protein n=1 Tax=Nocardia cyriacigeorgica TaxID=135487 RepID=A0A6P1CXI3_9NOCA|nr:hypothetical protein [Nocardia cyriacigeorgica]MBF6425661.1 hypothetical protein [Nocardia cyriacigeorgica]NEW36126.1 hypothetical protein [Nocardia cyriacigeorgica]
MIAVLVVVVAGGAFAFVKSKENSTSIPDADGWSAEMAPIANAFPRLVPPTGLARGWRQVTCASDDMRWFEGADRGMWCVHHDSTPFISFYIVDYGSREAVAKAMEAFMAPGIVDKKPGTSQRRPHRDFTTEPLVVLPSDYTITLERCMVCTAFPDEPGLENYIIAAKWHEHTAEDILENWWEEAPFGRG